MLSKIISADVPESGLPVGVAKNMMFEQSWSNHSARACSHRTVRVMAFPDE